MYKEIKKKRMKFTNLSLCIWECFAEWLNICDLYRHA